MTATARTDHTPAATRTRRSRLLRSVGWTLIAAGSVVLLYLVYSLLFTNLETSRAQAQLLETWEQEVGAPADAGSGREQAPPAGEEGRSEEGRSEEGGDGPDASVRPAPDPGEPPEIGTAVAMVEFVRPGTGEPVVRDEPVLVVAGVSAADLRAGPGRYPGTALPGGDGNFAVAGHRTTYGAPFFNLDELEPGDEIRVTGRDGGRHVYAVVAQEIVGPGDTWVIGSDPLGGGRPLMTLTTCHPRFSAAQRLIVFAELVT